MAADALASVIHDAAEEVVLLVETMVDAGTGLPGGEGIGGGTSQGSGGNGDAAAIGHGGDGRPNGGLGGGQVLEQGANLRPGGGDGLQNLAACFGGRGADGGAGSEAVVGGAQHGAKEEGAVFDGRSAKGEGALMFITPGGLSESTLVEVGARVKGVRVVEPVAGAVEGVGAAFGGEGDHGAGGATVLGQKLVGDHAELGDGIGIVDLLDQSADGGIVRVRAIDHEIVGTGAHPVDGKGDAARSEVGITRG